MMGRLFHLAQRGVAGAGVAGVGVVPATEVERGHVGVLFVELIRRVAALPPVVRILAVRQQVDGPPLVGRQPSQDGGALFQREAPDVVGKPLRVLADERGLERWVGVRLPARDRHAEGVDEETLLEGAVLTHGTVVVVGRPHRDDHCREMRRVERRERGLVAAGVGVSHRAYLAIAPGLGRDPLHGVEAVRGLFGEGVELALRIEPSSHILDHAHVSAAREVVALVGLARRGLAVGRALQHHREGAFRPLSAKRRIVHVGRQGHAVASAHNHVALGYRVVLLYRAIVWGCHRGTFRSY